MSHKLAILCTAALASAPARAQTDTRRIEPPIEQLVEQLGQSGTAETAARALVELGQPAVLPLRRALSTDTSPATVTGVLITLGRLRENAVAAVPDLLVALRQGPDRTDALWALAEVGPYSPRRADLPEQILSALGPTVRFFDSEVTRTLSRLTLDPGADLKGLTAALDEGNPHVWEFVAEILARTERHDGDPVPLLLRILETPMLPGYPPREYADPVGRRFVLSFSGRQRVPDLVKQAAAGALVGIEPESPDAVPAYLVLLESIDPETRRDAVMALGRQGALAADAVPALRRSTRDPDLRVVREAITALGMMGSAAMPAIPALERLLDHEDEQVYQRARVALRQIRGGPAGMFPEESPPSQDN